MSNLIATIRTVLSAHRQVPEITPETSFRDLDCDSVDMVCIEMAVCDDFDVYLPAADYEACETVGDLAALVERVRGRVAA